MTHTIRDEIDRFRSDYEETLNRSDFVAVAELYTENATVDERRTP